MEVQTKKTKMQYNVAKLFFKKGKLLNDKAKNSVDNGRRGSIIMPTGTGKTRIGVILIDHFINTVKVDKVLVLTPTEVIRDIQWKKELEKWNAGALTNKVQFECINTAYKYKDKEFDLVIADEVDVFVPNDDLLFENSSKFYKFFMNNKIKNLVGFTAEVPFNKRRAINSIAPVLFKMNINEAVSEGFISNFKILNFPVKLTEKEQEEYDVNQEKYLFLEEELGGVMDAYYNAQTLMKNKDGGLETSRAYAYMSCVRTRSNILMYAKNRIPLVNQFIDYMNKPVIVFNEYIDLANEVRKIRLKKNDTVCFHNKITPKSRRINNLKEFSDSHSPINVLSTVKAINRGYDVPKVKFGIVASSGDSQKYIFIQRIGRVLRLDDELDSLIIQLYVPNSQDEKWLKGRTYGIRKDKMLFIDDENFVKQEIEKLNGF